VSSIADDRGYNQGFVPTKALEVRSSRRCQRMVAEMVLPRPHRILELGCGTGHISKLLAMNAGTDVLGTDLCRDFIEQARRDHLAPNLSFEVLDVRSPDLSERLGRQFDYIVGNGILHHLYEDLDRVLPGLKDLLAPGGKLIFWEPNLYNPYVFLIFKIGLLRRMTRLEPQEMAFTKEWISRKLADSGFSHFRVEYSDFLLPNTPYRLIQYVIRAGDILERMPLINRWAQSLFISARKVI
jgi:SAM-dependent methyltransferase